MTAPTPEEVAHMVGMLPDWREPRLGPGLNTVLLEAATMLRAVQAAREAAERDAAKLCARLAKIADDAAYYLRNDPVSSWAERMRDIELKARGDGA